MAYINTDDFLELFAVASIGQDKQFINTVKMVLEDTPVADVVEVVRCKDCTIPHNKWLGCPKMNGLIPPPNHFCSYGERRNK